jgi:hypothetical protein
MEPIELGPGMIALQRGDLNGAVTGFMQSLEKDPNNIPIHLMLGLTLNRARSWQSALRVFYNVIRIDPSGQHPTNNPPQVDDGVAEALIGWAKDHAAAGYTSAVPSELAQGLAYYLQMFRLHTNDIASVEAAIQHQAPIAIDFRPHAAGE